MSLKQFIERENQYRIVFKQEPYNINELDTETADILFRKIDNNLSPESLYADGERPRAQAQKLARMLVQASKDLQALGFNKPTGTYNLPDYV